MYVLHDQTPTPEDFVRLRACAGLSPRSIEAARRGLPRSWASVIATIDGGPVVGMGRLIGDGSLALQVVDMAVEPEHQRRGIGRRILTRLLELAAQSEPDVYLSLVADPPGQALYRELGFTGFAPSIGMELYGPSTSPALITRSSTPPGQ
ncbi:GNAT family N-acetyltransferase [Pseudonocardia spinosispora]|uniref:GNAT family N-acetyltransferase n=1 Tax=Pseudonocardia spinosispora TaxID=103441 RepID=UPI00040407FB|nr:GNAT family N-acetyltransferase [Pseudonocardia spinosispora]